MGVCVNLWRQHLTCKATCLKVSTHLLRFAGLGCIVAFPFNPNKVVNFCLLLTGFYSVIANLLYYISVKSVWLFFLFMSTREQGSIRQAETAYFLSLNYLQVD